MIHVVAHRLNKHVKFRRAVEGVVVEFDRRKDLFLCQLVALAGEAFELHVRQVLIVPAADVVVVVVALRIRRCCRRLFEIGFELLLNRQFLYFSLG